jgi:kinesin family protein 4/21/27
MQVSTPTNHSFTFDHVYGPSAAPSSKLFHQCVDPLVQGLFKGYNATVLAYGQTGSGKTYTMGSAFAPGRAQQGVIPQAMELLFTRIAREAENADFTVRVGFVEIHKVRSRCGVLCFFAFACVCGVITGVYRSDTGGCAQEEIRDLLVHEPENLRPSVTVREAQGGGVCLAGAKEQEVTTYHQMAEVLEQGSLARHTASTNMNSQSSRSHAIFTITLEQRKKAGSKQSSAKPKEASEDEVSGARGMHSLWGSTVAASLFCGVRVAGRGGGKRGGRRGGRLPVCQDALGGLGRQ